MDKVKTQRMIGMALFTGAVLLVFWFWNTDSHDIVNRFTGYGAGRYSLVWYLFDWLLSFGYFNAEARATLWTWSIPVVPFIAWRLRERLGKLVSRTYAAI